MSQQTHRQPTDDALGVPIVEAARRAPSFDNCLSFSDGTRFLTDPMAERYIVIPPMGGTMQPGMLPPQEMQVRAALIEASAALGAMQKTGFWAQLFGKRQAREASDLFANKIEALASCVALSKEHRAAATRLERSYPGTVRGLLKMIASKSAKA